MLRRAAEALWRRGIPAIYVRVPGEVSLPEELASVPALAAALLPLLLCPRRLLHADGRLAVLLVECGGCHVVLVNVEACEVLFYPAPTCIRAGRPRTPTYHV